MHLRPPSTPLHSSRWPQTLHGTRHGVLHFRIFTRPWQLVFLAATTRLNFLTLSLRSRDLSASCIRSECVNIRFWDTVKLNYIAMKGQWIQLSKPTWYPLVDLSNWKVLVLVSCVLLEGPGGQMVQVEPSDTHLPSGKLGRALHSNPS